jgi:hypothetical protein
MANVNSFYSLKESPDPDLFDTAVEIHLITNHPPSPTPFSPPSSSSGSPVSISNKKKNLKKLTFIVKVGFYVEVIEESYLTLKCFKYTPDLMNAAFIDHGDVKDGDVVEGFDGDVDEYQVRFFFFANFIYFRKSLSGHYHSAPRFEKYLLRVLPTSVCCTVLFPRQQMNTSVLLVVFLWSLTILTR